MPEPCLPVFDTASCPRRPAGDTPLKLGAAGFFLSESLQWHGTGAVAAMDTRRCMAGMTNWQKVTMTATGLTGSQERQLPMAQG